jgi:hypothetical protein
VAFAQSGEEVILQDIHCVFWKTEKYDMLFEYPELNALVEVLMLKMLIIHASYF